jgi:hypothetical protein
MIKSIYWKQKEKKTFLSGPKKEEIIYFYILIPALREQNVIKRTLDNLLLLDYPDDKFEIIIALDAKEKMRPGDNFTTKDVLKKYISNKIDRNPKISFVEYQGHGQRRALQLNEALNYVAGDAKQKNRNYKNIFVGVYDADSFPDRRVLKYINYKALLDKNNVAFQQTLNYLLNSDNVSKIQKFLLLGNAYYQTMWNYTSEINRFFGANKKIRAQKHSLSPPYCMGHGEFFELDTLLEIGGFPLTAPADGIQIGFVLGDHMKQILPIPFDDYCESPEKLSVLFRQHTFWAFGNSQFFKTIKVSKVFSLKFVQSASHLLRCFKWALCPFFVIPTLILLFKYNFSIFLMSIIVIWFYYLFGYFLIRKFLLEDAPFEIKPLPFRGVEIPFSAAYTSFGAINGLLRLAKSYLSRKPVEVFSKVER